MAALPDDRLAVADETNHRVVVLNLATGAFEHVVGSEPALGNGPSIVPSCNQSAPTTMPSSFGSTRSQYSLTETFCFVREWCQVR